MPGRHAVVGADRASLDADPRVPAHDLVQSARAVAGGGDQSSWLNEGLSHFAEELGWRKTPPSACTEAPGGDCYSEFLAGDLANAYDYLNNTEGTYLIAPTKGDGSLAERGAAWLFVRWLADHVATDSILGTSFTRGLEAATTLGAARIEDLAGIPFATLVGEWQLANWTDDLPEFPQTGLITYRSWDFRTVYADNYPDNFSKVYPLTPDSTNAAYNHVGALRAGSGRTVRYQVPAGSPGVVLRLAGNANGGSLSTLILPYFAVARVK